MKALYLIVDELADWAPYYPTDNLVSAADYLAQGSRLRSRNANVINLCQTTGYLGTGYYCSLLAEARNQKVIPSVSTLNDLNNRQFHRLDNRVLEQAMKRLAEGDNFRMRVFFGKSANPLLAPVASQLFEHYPCPVLEADFEKSGSHWQLRDITAVPIRQLTADEQDLFGNAIEQFSRQLWRKPRSHRQFRYDLAILHDPQEKLPPSNSAALNRFRSAGRQLGIDVELITHDDYVRLLEFDALFIRETTSVNHDSYRFAKRAEKEGLVVIDDPTSILRCTNKVFLADLLTANKVETPHTLMLFRDQPQDLQRAEQELGYPLVLKIPDGSFSRGVVKVNTPDELRQQAELLFGESAIILVQEFVPTEYDWRIGVLDRRPIYACKYYMARGHWQIYNHDAKARQKSGGYEAIALQKVPKSVVQTALRATNLIGSGLYGVDIKLQDGRCMVIEINDNPSIESGVEDAFLGEELYRIIMNSFLRRLERRHAH